MKLLEFENQILLESQEESCLIIFARGLAIERSFFTQLKCLTNESKLIFVINCTNNDELYFLEQLIVDNVQPPPKRITNDIPVQARHEVYEEGGIQFITSRILVVDLLSDRVPMDKLAGVLIYKAHKLYVSHQEPFIIRLIKLKKKSVFVRAFTDQVSIFDRGINALQKLMQSLFVQNAFLWPRFHADIVSQLETHKPEVIEVQVSMSPTMHVAQSSLLDIIAVCIREIKACNRQHSFDELTVENTLGRWFDFAIKLHFEQVWFELSQKTRQLIDDLKSLRMIYLELFDAATFYGHIEKLKTNHKIVGELGVGWIYTDSAQKLFKVSKERAMRQFDKNDPKPETQRIYLNDFCCEICPKWKALVSVLSEISESWKSAVNDGILPPTDEGNIVLLVSDHAACRQLKMLLEHGMKRVVLNVFNKNDWLPEIDYRTVGNIDDPLIENLNIEIIDDQEENERLKLKTAATFKIVKPRAKRKRNQNPSKGKKASTTSTLKKVKTSDDDIDDHDLLDADQQTLTQICHKEATSNDGDVLPPADEVTADDLAIGPSTSGNSRKMNLFLLPTFDRYSLLRVLGEKRPSFFILYSADVACLRTIEMFKATNRGLSVRIYFLMYANSTEEQRYLTSLRKEKDSFEKLIHQKQKLTLSSDYELLRDPTPFSAQESTDAASDVQIPKVIVDLREFRSELPSLVHRIGIDLTPVTLEVGDYVLSDDTCLERKSLNDLIGSLTSGRLYNQAKAMIRFYKRAVLLVEFDADKPFQLRGKQMYTGSNVSTQEIWSKLVVLILHFPQLRIIWSQSPEASAEMIQDLKWGRTEPDVKKATEIGLKTDDDAVTSNDESDSGAQMDSSKQDQIIPGNYQLTDDVLLNFPGINAKNLPILSRKTPTLYDLCHTVKGTFTTALKNRKIAQDIVSFVGKDFGKSLKLDGLKKTK